MQRLPMSCIDKKGMKIPYFSIFAVCLLIILFIFLWRPLNQSRAIYIPLTPEVETTVVEKQRIPAVVGNATIAIVEDRPAKENTLVESLDQPKPEDEVIKDEIDEVIDGPKNTVHYVVERGDTLYGIMMQYGVNRADIYLLTKQFKQLANLRIGQQISWTVDDDHNLKTFNWVISNNNIKTYERDGDKFNEKTETREGVWKPFNVNGEISSSFVADAKQLGLTTSEIAAITKALQWKLDFRKLQKGDQFSVILSREMFDNELANSQLLGVRIKNGSSDYYAILAEDGQYYDIDAASLSQSFLRHPLEKQARISSGFNPKRVNPVTKKVTPHNGVDYAVSRGTPVLSAGDGEVVIAKFSGSAGNYVAIRHGRQYLTKYMHLDKLLVKQGQQVKKGDKIGLSGNTGRSTGPHLHYELHINGKPVNSLTANLPVSEGLTGKSKTSFLEQVKNMKEQLALISEKGKPGQGTAIVKSGTSQ